MMKFIKERAWLVLVFLSLSALVYFIHFLIFRDVHHIFIYMVGDLGFLFLDVMLVVIVIEQLLLQREKKTRRHKVNMLIGTFFSQIGNALLAQLVPLLENTDHLREITSFNPAWKRKDFAQAMKGVATFLVKIQVQPEKLAALRDFLLPQQGFLISLLSNPTLLEHEFFTDLLWAIFHLADELSLRPEEMKDLPPADLDHLNNDITRVVKLVLIAWVDYVAHLKENYPFLFSLVVRVNPFLPGAQAIVS